LSASSTKSLENKFYALLGQLEHYESLEWAEQKQ